MIRSVNCDQIPLCQTCVTIFVNFNIAELNPICHLLALLGAHHILHVSRERFNTPRACDSSLCCSFESPRTLWCLTLDNVVSFY